MSTSKTSGPRTCRCRRYRTLTRKVDGSIAHEVALDQNHDRCVGRVIEERQRRPGVDGQIPEFVHDGPIRRVVHALAWHRWRRIPGRGRRLCQVPGRRAGNGDVGPVTRIGGADVDLCDGCARDGEGKRECPKPWADRITVHDEKFLQRIRRRSGSLSRCRADRAMALVLAERRTPKIQGDSQRSGPDKAT